MLMAIKRGIRTRAPRCAEVSRKATNRDKQQKRYTVISIEFQFYASHTNRFLFPVVVALTPLKQ